MMIHLVWKISTHPFSDGVERLDCIFADKSTAKDYCEQKNKTSTSYQYFSQSKKVKG